MRVIPGTRLLIVFAIISIILTLVTLMAHPILYYGIMVIFAGVIVLDLFISYSLTDHLALVLPEIVRLSKNRETMLSLTVLNKSAPIKQLKIGFLFPNDGVVAPNEKEIQLLPLKTIIEWPIKGIRPGQFCLDLCFIETASRFGLWAIRKTIKIQCELRIYPDMVSEKHTLAALFRDFGCGIHSQKSIGKGREFERLREYLPGDPYEDIHWKATARRGVPVSKIYQMERTQDVYVLIDAARMSARNARQFTLNASLQDNQNETLLDKYITTALSIGLAVEKQGDNFGLGLFSDKMEKFIPAGNGKAHYNACRDILYTTRARPVTPDFTELITFVGNTVKKRSLVILLTHLDDPALSENLINHIHILSRRHLVMVNMLNPLTAHPLFTSEEIHSTDDIFRHLAGHMLWHFLARTEKNLQQLGIGFFRHAYQELTVNTISQYLAIKQRQIL